MGKIIIKVMSDGRIESEAVGFTGNSCTEKTEFLRKLGETETTYKPEYFQAEKEMEVEYDG